MSLDPLPASSAVGAFLLAFPALFSIVNPIGGALIFHDVIADRSPTERDQLAGRIAFYAALVLLGSLWIGGYVLTFFGVSLGALRIAGGLVVAVRAWGLLMKPEEHENRKANDAAGAQEIEDVAFFPLTMPFTTGPGSIAVAIALSSQRPANGVGILPFFAGMTAAALAIAVLIWLCYRWSDHVTSRLGRNGARIVSRLIAFLLLCVGVQIIVTGLKSLTDLMIQGQMT